MSKLGGEPPPRPLTRNSAHSAQLPCHSHGVGLLTGGDGGLHSAAVLLSVVATAKRHALNPWAYLRDVLTRRPIRPPDADLSDLLPDCWHPSDTSSLAARIAG